MIFALLMLCLLDACTVEPNGGLNKIDSARSACADACKRTGAYMKRHQWSDNTCECAK